MSRELLERAFVALDTRDIPQFQQYTTQIAVCLPYDRKPALKFIDNAFVEGQKDGKSAAVCDLNSAFQQDLTACKACIQDNGDPTESSIDPVLQPFIDFCAAESAQPIVESSTATATSTPLPVTATETLISSGLVQPSFQFQAASQSQAFSALQNAPSSMVMEISMLSSLVSVLNATNKPTSTGLITSVAVPTSSKKLFTTIH